MPPRSVCITECSEGGLGHALAKEFHSRGLRVFAAARTLESMATLAGSGIETFEIDIASSESISMLKDRLTTLVGGRLDILVINAGVAYPLAISDFDKERVKDLFNLNVFRPMEATRRFSPLIIAAKGCIVQVGSLTTTIPVPFNAAYIASIAALHSFGDTLRVELAPLGVKVLTLCAGSTETNLLRRTTLPRPSAFHAVRAHYQSLPLDRTKDTPYVDSIARAIVDEALGIERRSGGAHSWTAWIIRVILGRLGLDSVLATKFGLQGVRRRQVEGAST